MHESLSAPAPSVSVIIPTLNEEPGLGATLGAIGAMDEQALEVIVADGGSEDRTAAIASEAGARVVRGPRGRGAQLAAGAETARGEILWFLHADTLPPPDAIGRMRQAVASGCVAGHFHIRFDGGGAPAAMLTVLYRHLRWLGLRYGDSGYFVDRRVYEESGGFADLPLFEDLDLLRRLRRRGRFVRVGAMVTTSSRRFEGRSFTLVFARWAALQVLYWVGVSPHALAKRYPNTRGRESS